MAALCDPTKPATVVTGSTGRGHLKRQIPGFRLELSTRAEPLRLQPSACPIMGTSSTGRPMRIHPLGYGMESRPGRVSDARDVLTLAFLKEPGQLRSNVLRPLVLPIGRIWVKALEIRSQLGRGRIARQTHTKSFAVQGLAQDSRYSSLPCDAAWRCFPCRYIALAD